MKYVIQTADGRRSRAFESMTEATATALKAGLPIERWTIEAVPDAYNDEATDGSYEDYRKEWPLSELRLRD